MKRNFFLIIFLMVVLGFSCSLLRDKAYELAYDIISDLGEEGYRVEDKEIISDFANNTYTLFNLNPKGYLIVNDESSVLVEGSFTVDSPYENYDSDKYYLGPLNYIVKNNDGYYSIYDGENFEYSNDLETSSIKLNNNIKNVYDNELSRLNYNLNNGFSITESLNSGDIPPNPNGSIIDTSGWTKIDYHHYFSHLNYFPDNTDGTCGFVALSIILGYLDTFYHDDTIPNNRVYKDGRYYYLTQKSVYTGEPNTSNIPHNLWSRSPGTKDDMQYLLLKYKHYFLRNSNGYAVTGNNLKATFKDYSEEFIAANSRQNYYPIVGTFFNTHKKPREMIDNGIPTILVMTKYDSSIKKGTFHDVVAYGYKDDLFLAHFGWDPRNPNTDNDDESNITPAANVIINSATIESYFGIGYSGGHKHSQNVKIFGTDNTICGCGKVNIPVPTPPPGGGDPPPVVINGEKNV